MAAPTALWDLSRTADSAISVAQGILHASTSDNVQPLALLACERFGATLAMCQETCNKIERSIIKEQSPATNLLSFFGGVIGYSRHDCAAQLVRSMAGVQFMGLAVVLSETFGAFLGGQALAAALKATASDKTLLPPARHLKDLLNSLEYRCVHMGFSNLVAGWHKTIHKPGSSLKYTGFRQFSLGTDAFIHLVDAFRQLNRIGDASSLTLKNGSCKCNPLAESLIA